jgi:tetratricopeptide (TPR) repeat protein
LKKWLHRWRKRANFFIFFSHNQKSKIMKRPEFFSFVFLVVFSLTGTVILGQGHHHAGHDHGVVNFKTSCNSQAQVHFEHGLGMLHHMMYDQAVEIFDEAVRADPNCAMGYWGIAMTQLRPLWAPPTKDEFEKGFAAIEKAASLGAPSAREQDYIDALKTFYFTTKENNYRKGIKAWEMALEEVFGKYPDDIDAGAFYGLSLLATAPPDDKTYANQRKAGALLEELFERAPEHPGLFHYIIHAYDNTALASKGIEFAHGYDKLAPDVPHALHMPSHIFVRVGKWEENIDWNRRSADAALRQPVGDMTSMHHAHAIDYMIYGYLQQGRDQEAKAVLDELNAVEKYQPGVTAYNITAAQARYPLERKQWEEAAKLPLRVHSDFPWDNYPAFEAITWWARGLGSARSGDLESARKAVEKIKKLHDKTSERGEDYWALLVDAQRKTVKAWILHEEGRHDEAVALMREAADQEDSVDKHPVTPSAVLPARELLGDMLLLHRKTDDAIAAYEAALEISPNRFNSLYGAGRAAEMAGKKQLAEKYFAQLNEITVPGESRRPELDHVAAFFEEN